MIFKYVYVCVCRKVMKPGRILSRLRLRVRVWLSLRAAIAMFHEYVYTKYCYVN